MAHSEDARDHIDRAADKHGVPRERLRAMARVESRNDARAVSRKGARGEFQIMPSTAKELGYTPEDMHDREKGADAAAKYLRRMHRRFGNWDDAAAAYNAGPARVAYRKKKGIPLPKETRDYATRISAVEAAEALRKSDRK
jgi:soluble lytic murein transglycosylase-like protein